MHLERFPEVPLPWLDDDLDGEWDRLLEVRREVAKALEPAAAGKLIGSGLEASVRITGAPEDLPALLAAKRPLLQTLFIVSRTEVGPGAAGTVHYESQEIPGLVIDVDRAPGDKCERCWTRSPAVGLDAEHPTLCDRCAAVRARDARFPPGRRRRVARPGHQGRGARSAVAGRSRLPRRQLAGVDARPQSGPGLRSARRAPADLALGGRGLLSVVALVVLVRVALRVLPGGGWVGGVAIGFIFGGAVGNLIDRARFGAVVDFVDVLLARLALAGLQRRRLGHHGGRRAARALPHRRAVHRGARPASWRAGRSLVSAETAGERLDRWLAAQLPASRGRGSRR